MFPKPKCSFSLTFMHPLILGLGIILKIEPYLVKIARYIVITLDVGLSTNDNIQKVRQYVSVIAYQHSYTVIFFFAYPGWNFRNLALLVRNRIMTDIYCRTLCILSLVDKPTSKLRGRSQTTLTRFWLFFDHLPPSSCKRSLWMTPKFGRRFIY